MSDRARKLEKKRKKREQKRDQLHKLRSVSPVKQASQGRLVACCMNDDWEERGQAVAFVLREAGGRYVMASFMVDLWCAGLKDVGGHSDSSLDAFNEVVDRMNESMDDSIDDADIEEIADVVAGGVRFARQNGFKLPKDWQKWCALVDPELDYENAALDAFGKDGKLVWVGPMEDLRRRLIGSTVPAFLARLDVEYVTEPDIDGLSLIAQASGVPEDELGPIAIPEVRETLEKIGTALHDGLQAWCDAEGETPSPAVAKSVAVYLSRMMFAAKGEEVDRGSNEAPEQVSAAVLESMEREAREYGEPTRTENLLAVEQLRRFFEATRKSADDESEETDRPPEATPRMSLADAAAAGALEREQA